MFRETGISSLEASFHSMTQASFYPGLSDLHKAALQPYDVFKSQMHRLGHTFLLRSKLHKHYEWYNGKRTVGNLSVYSNCVSEFLVEQGVLKKRIKELSGKTPSDVLLASGGKYLFFTPNYPELANTALECRPQ